MTTPNTVPVPAADLAEIVWQALLFGEVDDPPVVRTVLRLQAHAPAHAARLLADLAEINGPEDAHRLVAAVTAELEAER